MLGRHGSESGVVEDFPRSEGAVKKVAPFSRERELVDFVWHKLWHVGVDTRREVEAKRLLVAVVAGKVAATNLDFHIVVDHAVDSEH